MISDQGSGGLGEIPPPFIEHFVYNIPHFVLTGITGEIWPNGERGYPLVTVTPLLLFLHSDPGMCGEGWTGFGVGGTETMYIQTCITGRIFRCRYPVVVPWIQMKYKYIYR